MKRNELKGGRADDVPLSSLPPKALAKGQRHEMEHTKRPALAREIASDHLAEDEQYYKKLDAMEAGSLKAAVDAVFWTPPDVFK